MCQYNIDIFCNFSNQDTRDNTWLKCTVLVYLCNKMAAACSTGTVVLLEVPERTEVGIDYKCWNVGQRFKGIKLIPPGLHFIYYR